MRSKRISGEWYRYSRPGLEKFHDGYNECWQLIEDKLDMIWINCTHQVRGKLYFDVYNIAEFTTGWIIPVLKETHLE